MGDTSAKITITAQDLASDVFARINQALEATKEQVGDATEQSMAAAGFLLARCAGRDKYFKITDAIFQNQNDIYNDPRGGLLKIAQANGLDEKKFTDCVNDANALQALNARVQNYVSNDHVDATPTFVVNGVAMEPGYHSLAEMDAAIAATPAAK